MSSHESSRRDRKTLLLAGLLFLLAVTGLLHVAFGDWRPSPGGNPWLVPMMAMLVILITSVLMAVAAWRRGPVPQEGEAAPGLIPVAFTACWAIAFFLAVQWLGLVIGSFLLLVAAMLLLSPKPAQAAKTIIPLACLVALALFLMFTRLAPVVLPDPLLF